MITMAGVDYNVASVSERERISFTTEESIAKAYARLRELPEVKGAVILSTCNRTELYISAEAGISAYEIMRELAGVEGDDLRHYENTEEAAMRHLCELGSGIKSQIRGEDQILAQVKDAIAVARESGAVDSILEVMFREAITAAKRIKTEISVGQRENSIVHRAIELIGRREGVRRVLVIGSGEIGRMAARALVQAGYHTVMTQRTYRHGTSDVPRGAVTVDYTERYSVMVDCDAVISATRSPHHTVELAKVRELKPNRPRLWLDLAIPRDIEPEIGNLECSELYDVDGISKGEKYADEDEKLQRAGEIARKHIADFEKWRGYQNRLTGAIEKKEYFPLFVTTAGKRVLVVGGGKVASRRIETLMQFTFEITVVAPEVTRSIEESEKAGRVRLIRREYRESDLEGCYMVIAATGEREVNRRVGEEAKERGIYVSVADRREECSVLFPAIAIGGEITAGLTSGGMAHKAVSEAARKVREVLS